MASGIYRIVHVESGKCYVGQSRNVDGRIENHFKHLAKGTHRNRYLQRAYLSYGADAFKPEILELCSNELLTEREQFWMDSYRHTGLYNLAQVAGTMAGYVHNEETRQRMSDSAKRRGMNHEVWRCNIGKPWSAAKRKSTQKPVMCNGNYYESFNAAVKGEKIQRNLLRRQLISDEFKEFYYVT